MNRWFKTSDVNKQTAYNQISSKTGLPAYAIEKDWWVVQTLAILFEMEIGKHLVFKGGTSLSKAWNLISRFSEDIDLAIDRSFLGFEGEFGSSQREKLRRKSKIYITDTLYPELQKGFKSKGIDEVKIEIEEIKSSVQDPVNIFIYFPNIIETPGYIEPRVKVEIGCRSLHEPFENRSIISILDESYPEAGFAQKSIQVPSVLPERTFLEKIFLLHEEFQLPEENKRVERLSRHLYDIYRISHTKFADTALQDRNLYQTIVKHRSVFTSYQDVDYNLHQPQTINFIPPASIISAWKDDYNTMLEQMLHDDSPNFDELIKSLTMLKEKINAFDWRMDISF